MTSMERNSTQSLKLLNIIILLHVPIFAYMAKFFSTQYTIAIGAPLVLLAGQLIVEKVFKSVEAASVMMGFTMMAMSAAMIHLGKGMIEWHFHIFVFIGILSLFANPKTIIAAALTAAVHHVGFYYFLPESVFNYDASIYIVAIHAIFVVVESVACVYLSMRFKHVLNLQDQVNVEIAPLVESIDLASKNSSQSCTTLLSISDSNSSAITQISSTAAEISSMAESTKEQISLTMKNMQETKKSVADSNSAIKEGETFLKSLNEIKSQMIELQDFASNQLSSVVESVNTISEKTKIINDIVFQTKLLSFNASVEAARAGEHGKGFSVVAEEIGGLASNSGTASEEISSIVDQSQTQLKDSVDTIASKLCNFQEEMDKAFSSWSEINAKLKDSFTTVVNNSSSQESSLKEISLAAEQQTEGVQELSDALSNIDSSSSENLTKLREIQEITVNLEEDSMKLNEIHGKISDKKVS
jgi:methyl-accepting chemotaxis protein